MVAMACVQYVMAMEINVVISFLIMVIILVGSVFFENAFFSIQLFDADTS